MKAKRKPGGRPKMAEGKRDKKITARFTADEYKLVEKLEKTLGVSKTDLVRLRLLDNATAVVINAKELIGSVDGIGTELGRCGNNINQLAKYANILQKKGRLDKSLIDQFNVLMTGYLEKQEQLEVSLRRIIRAIGR
ncbi:MAG: plasmid mobilization protein [Flavisolibacter sp.]